MSFIFYLILSMVHGLMQYVFNYFFSLWFSVVESVGENVEEVKEGDIVIPVFQTNCGECRDCKCPKGNICSKFPEVFFCGMPRDGSSRLEKWRKIAPYVVSIQLF